MFQTKYVVDELKIKKESFLKNKKVSFDQKSLAE
jgi:hypothetical protein